MNKDLFTKKFKKSKERIINNYIVKHDLSEKKVTKEQKGEIKTKLKQSYMNMYKKMVLEPNTELPKFGPEDI